MTRRTSIVLLTILLTTLPAVADFSSRLTGPIETNAGTPQATWQEISGQRVLDMQCPFDTNRSRRCFWDFPVSLDLRDAAALQLTLRCPDTSPIAQFNLYLRSNGVWHAATFTPQGSGQWERIQITKSSTRPEGTSKGWGRIDRIRLAAWRGDSRGTSMQLADIQTVLGNPTVAILRGRGAESYAARIAGALSESGVLANVIDQEDAGLALFQNYRILFVPHLPQSDAKTEEALLGYIRSGGHPIVFYTIPDRVLTALGFEAGSYFPASRLPGGLGGIVFEGGKPLRGAPERFIQHSGNIMGSTPRADQVVAWWADSTGKLTTHPAILLSAQGAWMTHVYLGQDQRSGPHAILALAGHFAPELWRTAALARLREAPKTVGAEDMSDIVREFHTAPEEAQSLLRQAVTAHNQAIRDLAARRYLDALQQADICRQQLIAAVLAQTRAPQGEFRAVWCHRGYGINGWSWEKSAQRLHELGFNAVFPNVVTAGSASYPSKYLPPTKACRQSGDQLAACLAACRPRGIQVHAWMLGLSLGVEGATARAGAYGAARRLQVTSSGSSAPYLCPNHPANVALLHETVHELLSRYPVDGIHLDFMRYAGEDYCYCRNCQRAFEKSLGRPLPHWPKDAQTTYRSQWLAFRRATISNLVSDLRNRAKATRPSVVVSAAVFENWLTARDTVAQDWQAWCRRGWLDMICPMDYTSEPAAFRETVLRQQDLLRGTKVRLFPGIGLSSYRLEAMPLIRQIAATRELRTGGFVLFEYNESEATQTLPQIVRALSGP